MTLGLEHSTQAKPTGLACVSCSLSIPLGARGPLSAWTGAQGPLMELAGLLLVRLLVVRELLLDLCVADEVGRIRLPLLRLDHLLQTLTNIVIRRGLQIARLHQLDHMPAVLGL